MMRGLLSRIKRERETRQAAREWYKRNLGRKGNIPFAISRVTSVLIPDSMREKFIKKHFPTATRQKDETYLVTPQKIQMSAILKDGKWVAPVKPPMR